MFQKSPAGPGQTRGARLLLAFLVATLLLSLWLGYQAVDAMRSHRLTAERVLADYAGIAAWQFTRSASDDLDDFVDHVLEEIPWRYRAGRQSRLLDEMAEEMDHAAREADCRCEGLLDGAVFFQGRLDDASFTTRPDVAGEEWWTAVEEDLVRRARTSSQRIQLVPAPSLGKTPRAYAFSIVRDEDERPREVYGFAARYEDLEPLFAGFFERAPLFPPIMAESSPNRDLVRVTVGDPAGQVLFGVPLAEHRNPVETTFDDDLASLVVYASMRPDVADRFIIGGLPQSRLPLLAILLLLTLGVGVAAAVQVRREWQLARLRDDFVSGVSHELRTPLTQIRMFGELLESEKLTTPEERRRATSVITREAGRLTHQLENVLFFSRLRRAPGARSHDEVVRVRRVAEEAVEAFAPLAAARRVTLRTDLSGDPVVRGSSPAFHQILTNLLDNALKYGPEGQTVTVSVNAEGGRVQVAVEDQGPGIPKSDRESVWDPFYRLDRDVTGQVLGSGIGLAVVAELARRHGGRAWVEAPEGGGARFVVSVPESDETRLRAIPTAVAHQEG